MKKMYISVLVSILIFVFLSNNVVSTFNSSIHNLEQMDDKEPHDAFTQAKMPNTNDQLYKDLEITLDYSIQEIFRAGKTFKRILINNGGIECGLFGEERPFFQYSILTSGDIDSISVELSDSTYISAAPTPYLVPQKIGINNEVLDSRWESSLKDNVNAEWSLHHLSDTTIDGGNGELYSLKVYPVEYTVSGKAFVYNKIKVQYSISQNYMWLSRPDPGHKPTGPIKYLIITHSDLIDAIQPLALWKSQKGLFSQVITVSEIDEMYKNGDLQFKMRKYIQKMENIYDLDYLLLVGDWDKVPTRNTKNSYAQPMMGEPDNFASDLYFACVDSNTTWNKDGDFEYAEENEVDDCIPDMANGRLAINSPSILTSVVTELIDREKNLPWDLNTEKAIYMCGDPGYMPGDPTEVMDYFWNTSGKDVFSGRETIYYDESGSMPFSSNSFKEIIDDRYQAMCYFGHGKPDGFPELFTNNQVNQLINNGTDGSLFAMACLTGWFDDPKQGSNMGAIDNCFGEVLTETPKKGVVGFIGSSRNAVGYIDTTYSGDAPGLEEDYWRAIKMAVEGNLTPTVGEVWRKAITNFASSFFPFQAQGFDNPALRTFLEYNLLGEPDAPLIFKEPESLQLQFDLSYDKTTLWVKASNASGEPVENAVVSIYNENELGRTYKTNSKGEVTILIPPNNGGEISITVTRSGDKPVNDTFILPDTLEPSPEYSINPESPDGNSSYYVTAPLVRLFGDESVDVEFKIDDGNVKFREKEASIAVPNGNHTIYFRVVDETGHWSNWAQFNISVDLAAPELFINTIPESPDGNNGWFITKPKVVLKSNEILNSSFFRLDNDPMKKYQNPIPVDEGSHDISFIAYDLAGNVNKTDFSLKVDHHPPVSELDISHSPDGKNGYYITPPKIELQSISDLEVSFEYKWDSNNWKTYDKPIYPSEGVHVLYFRGIDSAGNVEMKNNQTFYVDMNSPVLEIFVDPGIPAGENNYYLISPVVRITTSEGEIFYSLTKSNKDLNWAVDGRPLEGNIEIPEGKWILYAKAVDQAGNEGYLDPISFNVDLTPPDLTWEITPPFPEGENDWYSISPMIEMTSDSADNALYWAYVNTSTWEPFNDDIILTSGVHRLKFKAIDLAGNEYTIETNDIKVDLDAPNIFIDQPQIGSTLGSSFIVKWSGEDEISGISYYKIKMDTKNWEDMAGNSQFEFSEICNGKHVIHIKAVDEAGNSVVVSQPFTVDANAPEILTRTPRGKNVIIDSRIVITFSEEMKRESVIIVVDGVEGEIVWENNSIIFYPNKILSYSIKYNVKVSGSDIYNNSISNYSWYFTTESGSVNTVTTSNQNIYVYIVCIAISMIVAAALMFVYYRKRKK
jgi:hypothetical protein